MGEKEVTRGSTFRTVKTSHAKAVRSENLGAVRPTKLEQKQVKQCGVPEEAREVHKDQIMQSPVGHDKDLRFYHKSRVHFKGLRREMM